MSKGCCGECRAWARAFTPVEALLAILEFILLALLIAFLVFVVLHLLFCPGGVEPTPPPAANANTRCTASGFETLGDTTEPVTQPAQTTRCTANGFEPNTTETPDVLAPEITDGEEVNDEFGFLLALVKQQPSGDTFGCILTAISPYWVVTAASCIESVEEVDSLDEFVIVEGYGRGYPRARPVAEVRVHPGWGDGGGDSDVHDMAALRAARRLSARPAKLATAVDYYRFAIGERLALLGFGTFRSEPRAGERRARAAGVAALPRALCSRAAPRHLRPLGARAAPAPRAAPLCAGVLYQRGAPCQFCAGAALVRGGALLGVSARGACGAACEPARVAAAPRWLAALAALADRTAGTTVAVGPLSKPLDVFQ